MKVRITTGPYRGREKTLVDKALTIGRDIEAGIQILDRSASRFHAEVFPVGGMWFVRDLDSKNGTYVNDEKIGDEELLRQGDVIKIGSTEILFEAGAALKDDESSSRISFRDEPDALSKTLEFSLDALSDISEPSETASPDDGARSLRMLYQIGRLLSDPGDLSSRETAMLDYLIQHLPCESAVVFRREGVVGKLLPATVRTSSPSVQPVISRSIVKKAFSENKALHIANAQDDTRFDRASSVVTKGVRSVLAVPLVVVGTVRGVLYLARSEGVTAFEPMDLELVSGVAIQLGMCHLADEQRKRHRLTLVRTVEAFAQVIETHDGISGQGERLARFCSALSGAMHLDSDTRERVVRTGLLFPLHQAAIRRNAEIRLDQLLERIDEFEVVAPILRAAAAIDDDADTEAQIVATAWAFLGRLIADPGADAAAVISSLRSDALYDPGVLVHLEACHLDGSLYAQG